LISDFSTSQISLSPCLISCFCDLPGSAAPLFLLLDKHPSIPKTTGSQRPIPLIRSSHPNDDHGAITVRTYLRLFSGAATVNVGLYRSQEYLPVFPYAASADDSEIFSEQRGKIFCITVFFSLQHLLVQDA